MKRSLMASAAMFLVISAAPAWAQEPAKDAASMDDIVVTASREKSLLSKTPIAMTAVTGEGLRDAGITNATTLADAVPNLSIDRNNGLQITIRGITSTDNTEKGDPSAAFLVDGVFIARAQALEVSFFDLDRVEVLRGPQGTLYGRNTTAGLVNVISARPKDVFEASFDGTYGNYNTVQATGMINLPVGENAAIRAAINYDRRDNYLRPGTSAFSLDPAKDNLSARLSGKIDFSDRINLYLKGDYSRSKGRVTNAVLLSNFFQLPFVNPASGAAGVDPVYISGRTADQYQTLGYNEALQSNRNDNNTWGIHGELSAGLSDRLTLSYLGSYRELHRDELIAGYTGSVVVGGAIVANVVGPQTFKGHYNQFSNELRLAYASDKLKAQAGVYYFKERSGIEFLLFGSQGFTAGQRGYIFGFPQDPTISKSLGFFGQATYSLLDSLRLTAGIRYTHDNKSRVGATIFHANVTDPLDFTTGVQPGTTNPRGVSDSLNNAAVAYSKMTWRVGLDYDLNSRTLLFATVSTGYKAGGFNDGCLATTTNCSGGAIRPAAALFYNPETLMSYEAGFKTRFLDNAVRLNGTAFHYEYKNLQLSQVSNLCGGPCQVTTNAGAAKVDGVELEGVVVPAPSHKFDFSLAYLNARYSDYLIVPGLDFAGKKLDRSPEWVVTAGYTLTVPIGGGDIDLGVHTKLSDKYYLLSSVLRAQFRQPGFTKTDLTATYNAPGNRWYIQGYVKNIENNITLGSAAVSVAFPGLQNGTASLGDPRTFGVRGGFKF